MPARGELDAHTATASFSEIRRGDAVPPSDRDFLRRVASEVPSAEPNHVMLFGHGAPPSLPLSDDTQRLLALSRTLVARFEPDALLLSVRLLVAPPGFAAQGWHLDYRAFDSLNAQTLFAALTPCTRENCTELLLPADAAQLERDVAEQLLRDRLVVDVAPSDVSERPLLLDEFAVCVVPTSRLPHRRGPTVAAGHTRVVLNVDFTTCSPAKLAAIGFVDDDAVSAAEGTFVGRDVVDDLHSEVVVRVVEPD